MTTATSTALSVRALEERDLKEADRIFRTAFGTFLGVPQPETFFGDSDYVRPRYAAPHTVALAAELDGELVGSNFVTNWGSVGFFGPLSVRVDLWDRGVASALMEETMGVFARWGTEHAGLFTWADSAKHHGLYQKFGFFPTFLTPVLSKPIVAAERGAYTVSADDSAALDACREISESVYPGLDLSDEIRSVRTQGLGDTVVLPEAGGFAVCHVGAGTEAGSGTCYMKFAAVRPGAGDQFVSLIRACEAFAARQGVERLVVGMNAGRLDAYRMLIERGFRTDLTGVAMQQGGDLGYNRPNTFVADDWR